MVAEGLLGRRVAGKFEIVELLGSGAMGSVYRAAQVALDKDIALKILHPSLRGDSTFVQRFHREAKAAAALEHPNSVSILDFGEEPDGLLYIAMEYLDGRDLFEVIQTEWPLSKGRIVTLLRQVLGAVARAHDTGVVHRDLKPENVMVVQRIGDDGEPEEVVKVCDFGIAHLSKSSPEESVLRTGSGLLVGTPEYMAPEVAAGEEPDARSDIYALGVMLYQMLTRTLPFEGDEPMRIALAHMSEPVVPPHQIIPDVDAFLEDIALMAMAREREDRFQSARQMRGALRAALENREYTAADLSGVMSVLPPKVAARVLSSAPQLPGADTGEIAIVNVEQALARLQPDVAPVVVAPVENAKAPPSLDARHESERGPVVTPVHQEPSHPRRHWPVAAAAVAAVAFTVVIGGSQLRGEPAGAASETQAEPTHPEPQATEVAKPVMAAPTPQPVMAEPAGAVTADMVAAPASVESFKPAAAPKPTPKAAAAAARRRAAANVPYPTDEPTAPPSTTAAPAEITPPVEPPHAAEPGAQPAPKSEGKSARPTWGGGTDPAATLPPLE